MDTMLSMMAEEPEAPRSRLLMMLSPSGTKEEMSRKRRQMSSAVLMSMREMSRTAPPRLLPKYSLTKRE